MALPDLMDRDLLAQLLERHSLDIEGDPEPIGEGFGYGSKRAAVTVKLESGASAAVVVKAWDAAAHGLDEVDFYATWAEALPIRLPACLGSSATADLGILVLERFVDAEQGNDEGFASRPVSLALAEMLALIHRATVGLESDLRLHRSTSPRPGEWHDARRIRFSADFGLPEGALRRLLVQSERADRLAVAAVGAAHPGLAHSDVHLDNVLITREGPLLLDWSHVAWGPAAIDLASLLVGSVEVEDYGTVIEAYREVAEVSDEAIRGALLHRVLSGTLGSAAWQTTTDRQERLKRIGVSKSLAAAAWLLDDWPALRAQLES